MYSYELQDLIKEGMINRLDYLKHMNCKNSTQICSIKYNAYSDSFNVSTKDGYNFHFKIRKEA